MTRDIVAALLVATVAFSLPLNRTAQAQTPSGHPLLGKWQWTNPQNQCTELYDFRPDGTVPVTSGAEKTDNSYTVAASPDESGFYRLTMKTIKDHGGKDCADDDADSTGQESAN